MEPEHVSQAMATALTEAYTDVQRIMGKPAT